MKCTNRKICNPSPQADEGANAVHGKNIKFMKTTFDFLQNNIRRLDSEVQELRDQTEIKTMRKTQVCQVLKQATMQVAIHF